MPLLDQKTFDKVTNALEDAGELELVSELRKSESDEEELLSSGDAAQLLGVSSINTVKNWLEGGAFPGARKTPGGHWRFPRSEVETVAARMKALREKNAAGELSPPDTDESAEPPLL